MSKKVANKTSLPPRIPDFHLSDLNRFLIFSFDLYPKWLYSINDKEFCNSFKKEKDAKKTLFKVFSSIIPNVQSNMKKIFIGEDNCHTLKGDKKEFAIKIAERIHGFPIQSEDPIVQIADGTGSTRVIGIIITEDELHVFYPLFIDAHHLIYPNKKHNDKDFKHHKFKIQN